MNNIEKVEEFIKSTDDTTIVGMYIGGNELRFVKQNVAMIYVPPMEWTTIYNHLKENYLMETAVAGQLYHIYPAKKIIKSVVFQSDKISKEEFVSHIKCAILNAKNNNRLHVDIPSFGFTKDEISPLVEQIGREIKYYKEYFTVNWSIMSYDERTSFYRQVSDSFDKQQQNCNKTRVIMLSKLPNGAEQALNFFKTSNGNFNYKNFEIIPMKNQETHLVVFHY